ncbi:DUF5696 domain-containing protein [Paenibacillus herberti]|uniref:Uncharacterized protein n=1 Tax=Paenibacillus herberti TaxID=1619309 RepID=A0A229P2H1_9BACL|nr:DUF5696 domain-containing protein [Paenibacillus herberti]OXM16308.1 hypothetical protein CGZ75_06385 [Paenibacillus herberti]
MGKAKWLRLIALSVVVIAVGAFAVAGFRYVKGELEASPITAAGKGGPTNAKTVQTSKGPAVKTGPFTAAVVKETGKFKLEVGADGRIAVTDKRNNHVWRSNPDEQSLASETVKGVWRKNLDSAFYLEYVDTRQAGSKLKYGNFSDLRTAVSVKETDEGAEITFDLKSIESSFVFVVSMKDGYLEVDIPSDRIKEGPNTQFVYLWAFPFFGAAHSDMPNGHMFVPSGMGATIEFDPNGKYPFRYTGETYGMDLSVSTQSFRGSPDDPSDVLLPVFGISYGQNALFGIITKGETNANINATPGGLYTSYNWIAPQFQYRQEYYRQTSSFGEGFNVYDEKRLEEDRQIRYYFLQGDKPEQINYVGMASAYRSYLMETKGLKRVESQPESLPLEIAFFGGDREPSMFGSKLVTTTTFDQAADIVDKLAASGITGMDIVFEGWSNGGFMRYLPDRLPPEEALGGTDALKRLIKKVQSSGSRFYLDDNFVIAYSGKGFVAREEAVRDSNTRVVEDEMGPSGGFSFRKATKKYWMQPDLSLKELEKSLPTYKDFGVDGVHHNSIGEVLFSDNTPANPFSRGATASIFAEMLGKTKSELGSVRVSHGNSFVLGKADHISDLPLSPSYDLLAQKSVPFYPIAIHGLVSYSGKPGNLRDEFNAELLRSVEYGAQPSYLLTFEDPGLLKDTFTRYIFSSQYSEWMDTIVKEYKRANAVLGGLQNQMIVNHRSLDKDVFETTYENGQRVIVNYGDAPYRGNGVEVKPNDFAMAGKGG